MCLHYFPSSQATGGFHMRKCIGSALLLVMLAAYPALGVAQRRAAAEAGPQNELGVDLAFQYVSLGSGFGSGVQLAAPVDVRVGFLARTANMFEVRTSLAWDSNFGSLVFAPGVNVLHQMRRGSGTPGLMRAPYVTAGVGLNIVKAFSGAGTETQFAIGAGVGRRGPLRHGGVPAGGDRSHPVFSRGLPRAFSVRRPLRLSV